MAISDQKTLTVENSLSLQYPGGWVHHWDGMRHKGTRPAEVSQEAEGEEATMYKAVVVVLPGRKRRGRGIGHLGLF